MLASRIEELIFLNFENKCLLSETENYFLCLRAELWRCFLKVSNELFHLVKTPLAFQVSICIPGYTQAESVEMIT
jgi:hypothetical protein